MTLHCVYYCYNADSEILYIGCTKNLLDRFSWHKLRSAWVKDLHAVRLRWFESRRDARRFEENAISRNRPYYNMLVSKRMNGKVFWVRPKREMPEVDADRLAHIKMLHKDLRRRLAARAKMVNRIARRVEAQKQQGDGDAA